MTDRTQCAYVCGFGLSILGGALWHPWGLLIGAALGALAGWSARP